MPRPDPVVGIEIDRRVEVVLDDGFARNPPRSVTEVPAWRGKADMAHRPGVDLRSRESVGDHDVLAGYGLLPDAPVASFEQINGLLKIGCQHGDARRGASGAKGEARSRQVLRLTKCNEDLQLATPGRAVVGPCRAISFEIDEFGTLHGSGRPAQRRRDVFGHGDFRRAAMVSAKRIRRRRVSGTADDW
ncbi:MAG: hypothetical protein ABI569_09630 [Casimicrobiaceae bacterium]